MREVSRPFCYSHARPALTADTVVLRAPDGVAGGCLQVLLIQRAHQPFARYWALPGGLVDEGECLLLAACRELHEETGLVVHDAVQVGAFGDPRR